MPRITSTPRTSGRPSNGSRTRSDLTGLAGSGLLAEASDERLVELARAGDERAFGAIVERYRAPLLRYCLGFLPSAAADDALQQAFINAYAALAKDDGRAPVALRPWLYRVAHNAALNVARDPQAGLAELPADLDGVERPDEVAQRRERFTRVVGAVRALPAKQRQVIVRHALDGDSHDSIAADLGMSAGAIRQLVHRARRTVREAAAGLLPVPVLRWLPFGPSVAESAQAVGGGAALAKVAATIAVMAAGGGAVQAVRHEDNAERAPRRAAKVAVADAAPAPGIVTASPRREPAAAALRPAPAREQSSSSGSRQRRSAERDSSGPGPGGDDREDSSGSGSSGSSDTSGSSGSGSSGSSGSSDSTDSTDSSGSGSTRSSGSGSSGSGSSGSSGSGSSDDVEVVATATPVPTVDNSGPGSTSSGSGSSGSSGSGSGGSDDGAELDDHSGKG